MFIIEALNKNMQIIEGKQSNLQGNNNRMECCNYRFNLANIQEHTIFAGCTHDRDRSETSINTHNPPQTGGGGP